ncbi:MAG TPA: acyl carrier protein, partial [Gaiellaceae bacterium]|nr:acyl carrier protein [Gaiellaceae bacterium]
NNVLTDRGLGMISPAEGTARLARLLTVGRPQIACAPFDARQWIEAYPHVAGSTWLAGLIADQAGAAAPIGDAALLAALRAAPRKRRRGELEAFITQKVSLVLRTDPGSIDRRQALREIGLDSLTSLELSNHLGRALGLKLNATLVFTYPSVATLAEHLGGALGLLDEPDGAPASVSFAGPESSTAPLVPQPISPTQDLEALSDDEADALLEQKLREMEERLG